MADQGSREIEYPIRLHVYLAKAGVASRRKAEEFIAEGRVRVNGTVIWEQGIKVNEDDVVAFDGKEVHPTRKLVYIALNKPRKYISSAHDPEGRPLVLDLVRRNFSVRLFTVGRLDFLSTGLIFLTNDGDFAKIVTHPSAEIEKEYIVETKKPVPEALLEEYRNGIEIDGEHYTLSSYRYQNPHKVHLVLSEGRNREIRNVFIHWKIGVKRLHRVRIGPVVLKGITAGRYRPLTESEVRWFFRQAGKGK